MRRVLVCQYTSCLSAGSAQVLAAFLADSMLADPTSEVEIVPSECQGQCNLGPTVRVLPDEIWYCRVKVGDVGAIAHQHLKAGQPVHALLHPRLHPRM